MSQLLFSMLAFLPVAWLSAASANAMQDEYPVPAEGEVQDGVPQGKIEGPFEFRSSIFAGTVREYWVYVPAQYDPAKPPCLMIVQDGLGMAQNWRLPTILDNMIHAGEVPVQLGIFVGHGSVPASHENAQPRFNRSFEYDGLGDRYARFLIDELLPEVAKTWKFSNNPDDRCLAGASSGGICAFNAAWERPDAFRRVISASARLYRCAVRMRFPDSSARPKTNHSGSFCRTEAAIRTFTLEAGGTQIRRCCPPSSTLATT